MRPFSYVAPDTLDRTLEALGGPHARSHRPLAGGTDLVPLMKAGIERPETLISLRRIEGFPRDISLAEDGAVRLGALCTLADIEGDATLARLHPALVQAASQAASPQLRNVATLGGTLLQRPRCWYFRHPDFHCWLKGGNTCHARDGANPGHGIYETGICRAAHPSDIACVLLALGACVEATGPDGPREIAVGEFLRPPEAQRRRETTLREQELVLAVRVPAGEPGVRSVFLKSMDRAAWSFATVSVAARMRLEGDRIAALEVVLGAVATVPWTIGEALAPLLGKPLDEARVNAVLRQAIDERATPLAMNGYKVPLARSLAKRAIACLAADAAPAAAAT